MIEGLRSFLLIAEHKSFTVAARHAHLSQPAVTQAIKRLEHELGARLLERGRFGAELTAQGRALLPHARAAIVAVDDGRRALRALDALEQGEVRIGGGATACTYLLPPVLAAFRKRYPQVSIYLREGPEERVVEDFERGELDLVVHSGAEGELLWDEDVVVVANPALTEEALPFIAFLPGSAVRTLLDHHFPGAEIAMELASISTVKGSVRAGLGRALISMSCVASDLALGRLAVVETPNTPIVRPLSLLHRGAERLAPAVRELRRMLLQSAPEKRLKRKAMTRKRRKPSNSV